MIQSLAGRRHGANSLSLPLLWTRRTPGLIAAVAFGLLAFWSDSARSAADSPGVDEALRTRAVETLRRSLREEQRWVKVHAAEFLLALDYPDDVKETFERRRG